jgi:hypothetical protein
MRVQLATTILDAATKVNGFDQSKVTRMWLRALKCPNIEEIYPGPDKVPPLPNRWVMVEQLKQQGKMQEYKQKRWEMAQELLEEKRLNTAKIAQLEAQAINLLAQADSARAAIMIQRFDSAINSMKEYNNALTERITALGALGGNEGEGGGNDDEGNSNAGGVGGMEGAGSNQGLPNAPPQMAGGNPGPMGGGQL